MIKSWRLNIVLLVVLLTFHLNYGQQIANKTGVLNKKLFSFGVIADIQYADVEKRGLRDYRSSLYKLKKCVSELNRHNLAFTINLGDLIDRDYSNFNKTLPILNKLNSPIYNVIGNHDFSIEGQYKRKVRQILSNKKGYFKFKIKDYTFIVLDGSDISTFSHRKESKRYELAMTVYEKLKEEDANNAYLWNGAIGSKQLTWLEKKLQKADQNGKKVVIFCHWPLLPENGTQLWNNKKILNLINSHTSVVAWISGHHHAGNYEKYGNIFHLTLKGLVEAQKETTYGIIEVYQDKLLLKGYGDQSSQSMQF